MVYTMQWRDVSSFLRPSFQIPHLWVCLNDCIKERHPLSSAKNWTDNPPYLRHHAR